MRLSGRFLRWASRAWFYFLFGFLFPMVTAAQGEVKVNGGFLTDSLKIGEETAFYLAARYPLTLTVLFPDSTHSFQPFEYLRKDYFVTESTGGISVDSAVYYLTTFEVDRMQALRLPVYVVDGSDSTMVHSQADTVLVTQLVKQVPDSVTAENLPLIMNTTYQKVHYDLNFWLMMIVAGALVLLGVIGWILFGKKIKRYFKARRMQKNHAKFLERYNILLNQLRGRFSSPATESALATWKKYMEQLESRPYTKLTTRETLRLVKEPALTEPLSRIDKAIYGHETTVLDSLENLKMFANRQFKRKMKEVQHG